MTPPLTRIGFLIPEYPGQTHSFFWRENRRIAARDGYETEVFSTRRPNRPVGHAWVREAPATYLYPVPASAWPGLLARLAVAGPRLLADRGAREVLRDRRSWPMVIMALRLGQFCRARAIDHLHVHSCANAALIAALCRCLFGYRYSLVLHGPIGDYGPHQRFKWQGADFAFVITEILRREMAEMFPDLRARMSVVPMGVETEVFTPAEERSRAPGDPFTWFCCARLNRVKGYDSLLAALDLLRSGDGPPVRLVVAGEDEQDGTGYRRDLEAEIAQRGLGDTITLLGAVPQDRVLSELQACDGFVLASRHEPLGVAYMEAMSCALPVVGTDAGGVPELIEDGVDGMLVPPGDPAALAGAMARIMGDEAFARRLGRAARDRVERDFSARRSAEAIVAQLEMRAGRS